MSTSPTFLRDLAWLSQASYLDFTGLDKNSTQALVAARLQNSTLAQRNRFTAEQASTLLGISGGPAYSFQHYAPDDSYGFSASVFKSSSGNEYTIAIRGTEFELSQPFAAVKDLLRITGVRSTFPRLAR